MKWSNKFFIDIEWIYVIWPRQCSVCLYHCCMEKMRRYRRDKPNTPPTYICDACVYTTAVEHPNGT